jgi:hypothetical protein
MKEDYLTVLDITENDKLPIVLRKVGHDLKSWE